MENPPKKLMIWKFPPYVFVNYVIPAQGDWRRLSLHRVQVTSQLSWPTRFAGVSQRHDTKTCTIHHYFHHKKTNVDVGKRGGVPAARHHEKSGNSRKLSGPSVFGLKHEITWRCCWKDWLAGNWIEGQMPTTPPNWPLLMAETLDFIRFHVCRVLAQDELMRWSSHERSSESKALPGGSYDLACCIFLLLVFIDLSAIFIGL